jgi:hypothetical protein
LSAVSVNAICPPPGGGVGDGDALLVGDADGDAVAVGDGEGDAVLVGDGDGEALGAGDGVAVAEGVGVGPCPTAGLEASSPPHAATPRAKTAAMKSFDTLQNDWLSKNPMTRMIEMPPCLRRMHS